MRALRYSMQEALVSLRRAGRSAAMSIGTVTVAFLTLGGFLLIAANLQHVVERWAAAAELSVFLRDDVDEAVRAALTSELRIHPAVAGVEYVSKEDALTRFRSDFPELADVAESLAGNPFPASLELRLKTDPESTGAAEALAVQLAEREEVADVRYDRLWLARLMAIVGGIRLAGFAVAAVLVLGAAFTVAAVVRLSLFARRDEIEIMRLVGSPFAYIRGPSVAEGTLIGGIGAAMSLLVLWGLFESWRSRLADALVAVAGPGDLRFLSPGEAALLVVAALLVGGLTGTLASRAVR